MSTSIRVLIVEDLPKDAELAEREILAALDSCEFRRAETREEFLVALKEFRPGLIVSGLKLPSFDGLTALKLTLEHAPDLPFIILTGSMNEDTAVECLKAGAWDYVIKEHVKRLGPAVQSALKQKKLRKKRRKAEEKLKASETRYRRLFESAKDGILILDADTGKVVDVNPFLIQLLGYSHDEFLGKKIWELGLFKDVAASVVALKELPEKQYICFEDLPLETRDGRRIDVEFVSNVYLADHAKVVQCNIRDITERKQAEEALRESQEKYKIITENMSGSVWLMDMDLKATFISPSVVRARGFTVEEVIDLRQSRRLDF